MTWEIFIFITSRRKRAKNKLAYSFQCHPTKKNNNKENILKVVLCFITFF